MEYDANPFWFSRIPTSAPWHSVPRRAKKIQVRRLPFWLAKNQVFKDSSHRTKAWEAASRCLQMGRGSWCWCTCSCVEPALQLKAAITGFPWASKRKALKQLTSEFDSIWPKLTMSMAHLLRTQSFSITCWINVYAVVRLGYHHTTTSSIYHRRSESAKAATPNHSSWLQASTMLLICHPGTECQGEGESRLVGSANWLQPRHQQEKPPQTQHQIWANGECEASVHIRIDGLIDFVSWKKRNRMKQLYFL